MARSHPHSRRTSKLNVVASISNVKRKKKKKTKHSPTPKLSSSGDENTKSAKDREVLREQKGDPQLLPALDNKTTKMGTF